MRIATILAITLIGVLVNSAAAKAGALLSQQDCPNQSTSDLCNENKLQSDVNKLQLLSQQDCPNQSTSDIC